MDQNEQTIPRRAMSILEWATSMRISRRSAYNEITAPKEIAVSPFGVHDVPRGHIERQLRHLREHLG